MQKLAIGIDLGGTNIKGVLIDQQGKIMAESKCDTNESDATSWKGAVSKMIKELKSKAIATVSAIGLSAPGLANEENNCISFMPGRMRGLEGFVWTDWVGETIWVLNDAHAAMMAEAGFGAAKGLRHAVLLTLGTGVGGGLLIDGKLYQGVGQMAGHFGHSSVNAETYNRDVTGMPGSLEEAIGNVTLPERSLGKYTSTEELVRDYLKGDAFATTVWLTSVKKLAVGIASAINVISPEVVVLSGGMVHAKKALLEPLESFLALYEWRPGGKQTPIKLSQFTSAAGAVGAASFAFSKSK